MNWNDDEWQNGTVEHPRYLVKADRTAMPFYRLEFASEYQRRVYKDIGLVTQLIDLTDYNWDENPGNIKFHKLK